MVVTSIDMADVIIAFSAKRRNWGCRTREHCDKAMLALLDRAKLGLDAAFHPDGYNVGINDSAAAIPRFGRRCCLPTNARCIREQARSHNLQVEILLIEQKAGRSREPGFSARARCP
jgi:hypothetical protein